MFAARPKGCAPLGTPAGGAPCTACLHKRLPATLPGPSPRGRGAGEERPDTLPAGLGRSGRVKGPCPRPLRGCGPHQPLDPPFTRKRARGPRRGLRGTVGVDGGQGSRLAATAQRLGLDAQERPQRLGWWLGVLFPQPPATWRTPRRPPEALLICSCFARVSEKRLSAPSACGRI